jgi:hypothetical protein
MRPYFFRYSATTLPRPDHEASSKPWTCSYQAYCAAGYKSFMLECSALRPVLCLQHCPGLRKQEWSHDDPRGHYTVVGAEMMATSPETHRAAQRETQYDLQEHMFTADKDHAQRQEPSHSNLARHISR